jgi:DNA modification methylase
MTLARFFRTNMLYCGDNLERLGQFPDESVDLIYLDPPFFSNRDYEVIWGDEAEVRSFEDRWDAGLDGYIDWMEHRVEEMHRVLRGCADRDSIGPC